MAMEDDEGGVFSCASCGSRSCYRSDVKLRMQSRRCWKAARDDMKVIKGALLVLNEAHTPEHLQKQIYEECTREKSHM